MTPALVFIIGAAAGTAITWTGIGILAAAAHHRMRRQFPTDHLDTTAIQPDAIDHELARIIREAAL